jgi:phenol hydroxylase P1 protein
MQIDIKTADIKPIRNTFDHVAERIGADKPASRYQEATFDVQAVTNFHYRPLWDPEHEIYDTGRTAIEMADWYAFRDPRQYYYGTWTMARARQQDHMEKNFAFFEKRRLVDVMPEEWRDKVAALLVPLRHVEYAANLNNTYMAAYGYGTAITQACQFAALDHLGVAQYLTRIGLAVADGDTAPLDEGKRAWVEDECWQPLRRLCEDMLVTKDWFELFVAQNLVLDGLLYPLAYDRFDTAISRHGGSALAMLTEFALEWFGESSRWVDATLKTAAAESDANRQQLEGWADAWTERVMDALRPLARAEFDGAGDATLDEIRGELAQRAKKKAGLTLA